MIRIRLFPILLALALLAGCATTPPPNPAKYQLSDFEAPGAVHPLAVSDPIASVNKGLYRFNYNFDRYLFLPVVNAYEFIMPDYAEERVSNFLDNIGEFDNFTNGVLQLKPTSTGTTLTRFAINTTLGIAGLWDPATSMNFPRQDEDFGQTLGHYGVGNGPYIVLPILGPSNLRDTAGLVADAAAFSAVDPLNFDNTSGVELPYQGVNAIDERHRQPFRYYKSGSPFEYELVRLLYTEKRKLQIAK